MKYVFFGTPRFGAYVLEGLIKAGFLPGLVITNPDRPVGRKKIIKKTPVKIMAEKYQIPVHQPESLKTENFTGGGGFNNSSTAQEILYTKWDFFVVAAYGKIIPEKILNLPRFGAINVHPSLLPKYRGPTPVQTAILDGELKTGVSLILLDKEVDHGPILAQKELKNYNLKTASYEGLSIELARLGAELLIITLPTFSRGGIKPVPQNHSRAVYTKKFLLEDGFVKYEDLTEALSGEAPQRAVNLDRMIRALNPEPGVWTQTNNFPVLGLPKNKKVKLLSAEFKVNKLCLKKIQIEGKSPRFL